MKRVVEQIARRWRCATLLVLVPITVLSLTPLDHLPEAPGSDKTHHLIAYLVLTLPVALRGASRWFLLLPAFVFWGGAIELLQPYVNRYAEWLDVAANSLGVALGALLGLVVRRMQR